MFPPAVHDGGRKGGTSETLPGLLVSMAERKLMIEVSEVLIFVSSAPASQQEKDEGILGQC